MSDDFGRFLADRYDEADALARAASTSPKGKWGPRLDESIGGHLLDDAGEIVVYDESAPSPWQFDHIAANDPAHRLADIKLKRAILALHHPDGDKWPDCKECSCRGALAATDCGGTVPWPCATARQLGTEFAEHPAYKEEWAAP